MKLKKGITYLANRLKEQEKRDRIFGSIYCFNILILLYLFYDQDDNKDGLHLPARSQEP